MRNGLRVGARGVILAATIASASWGLVACDDTGGGSSSGVTFDGGSFNVPDGATPPPFDSGLPPPEDAGAPDVAPPPAAATPTFSPAGGAYTSAQAVTIATTTAGADIFFTLDGTNPTTSSPVYTTPVAITQNTTVRAIAVAKGFAQSAVGVATYTITIPPGTTAPPTPTVVGGQYDNTQSVGLSSATAGATICYTLDGSAPSCAAGICQGSSATYSGGSPISVTTSGTVIRALACKAGNGDGVMPAQTYTFKAAAPTGTPPGPIVPYGTLVALTSATQGATIRVRGDGIDPTCSTGVAIDPTASAPIQGNITFKAIACRPGFADSNVSTIGWQVRANAPVTSLPSSTLNDDTVVTLDAGASPAGNEGNLHCYTTDGTDPACTPVGCTAGTAGTGPINVTKDNTTIRAVACRSGGPNVAAIQSAPITSATYGLKVGTIAVNDDTVSTFIPVVGDGEIAFVDVFLDAPATSNEKLCYTTNGSTPTCAPTGNPATVQCGAGSTEYDGEGIFELPIPVTVKAVGCKLDYQNSDVRTVTFADPTSTVGVDVEPVAGLYFNDQTLTMTATPGDATICYTIGTANPADPVCNVTTGACTTGTTYNAAAKPTVTATGTRVKVTACKVGIQNAAAVQTLDYTLQADQPWITGQYPEGSVPYGTTFPFTTTTVGATIRYTTGFGFDTAPTPTCSSPVLPGGAYVVTQNGTTNVKTVACKAGYLISAVTSLNLTMSSTLGAPDFSLDSGRYTNTKVATLSSVSASAPGAVICYTTDGTDPSCATGSNVCDGPAGSNVQSGAANGTNVAINASQQVRAITCANGFFSSWIASRVYTLEVSPLAAAPASGSYNTAVSPVISVLDQTAPAEKTSGVSICYTTNGEPVSINASCTATDPDTTCVVANSVNLNFQTTTTLKFVGCKPGFTSWPETTESYTINAYARPIDLGDGGVNDFVDAENALTATAGYTGYASYDATYVYFGFRGAGVGSLNTTDYVHWYVLAGGSPSTTTTPDNLGGGQFGNVALPSAFSHHVIWRTDNAQSIVRSWNGTQWVNSGVGVTAASGGSGASSYVEMRVTRAGLGNPTNFKMVGGLTAGGTNIATTPGNGAFWANWLDANMASFQNPNTASYIKP